MKALKESLMDAVYENKGVDDNTTIQTVIDKYHQVESSLEGEVRFQGDEAEKFYNDMRGALMSIAAAHKGDKEVELIDVFERNDSWFSIVICQTGNPVPIVEISYYKPVSFGNGPKTLANASVNYYAGSARGERRYHKRICKVPVTVIQDITGILGLEMRKKKVLW